MKIEAVIFDMDGTLIDTIEDIADANNKMLHSNGYPEHEISKYIDWIGNGAMKLVLKSLPDSVVSNEDKFFECLESYSNFYKDSIAIKSKLYKGIPEVLDFLSENGIKKSILTNKPHKLAIKIHEIFLNYWIFDNVIGQQVRLPKKPNPTVALQISNLYGIAVENIVFIGDSSVDIKTAIAAGMIPVGVTWGYDTEQSLRDSGCNNIVHSYQELLEFLRLNN